LSSAPSKIRPSTEPGFDLDYSIHDFEIEAHRDSLFLFRRLEEAMLAEGAVREGRTLDVACGVAKLTAGFRERGGEGWGLEPSQEMLDLSRYIGSAESVVLVRGVAETLPFRDGSFDRVICQGALDHFVDPHAFMRDAAHLVQPHGRVIIALANYESLSCRLGRGLDGLVGRVFRRRPSGRPYWEIPEDHHHKGDLDFIRGLGGAELALERCYGLSLLWLQPAWSRLLVYLPRRLADPLLTALDRLARPLPELADMIVSVWRPVEEEGAP
jgi:SAM-dependent methyltransferase